MLGQTKIEFESACSGRNRSPISAMGRSDKTEMTVYFQRNTQPSSLAVVDVAIFRQCALTLFKK
jgi:hypothetical protein